MDVQRLELDDGVELRNEEVEVDESEDRAGAAALENEGLPNRHLDLDGREHPRIVDERVPVLLHHIEELGSLDRVGELRRARAVCEGVEVRPLLNGREDR